MKKLGVTQIIGIVLLVVGAVVLVWGAYDLIAFNTSSGGKFANKMAGIGGKTANAVRDAVIMIVAGAAAACAGFFVYKKR